MSMLIDNMPKYLKWAKRLENAKNFKDYRKLKPFYSQPKIYKQFVIDIDNYIKQVGYLDWDCGLQESCEIVRKVADTIRIRMMQNEYYTA